MEYKEAVKQIKQKKFSPIYLCYGTEKFLMNEFIQFLINEFIDPVHKDFALSHFDLNETSIDQVVEDVETLPFMVPNKLVIAKNANFLTGSRDKTKVEHQIEKLENYIHSPVDYSVLVLYVQAEKLDERKKIVKLLKKQNHLVSFPPLKPNELSKWIQNRVKKHGCMISEQTAETFILYAGTNLQTLAAEIEKCCLFAGADQEITREMINQLVVRSVEQNIFILVDEIVRKKLEQALTIFYTLLKQKEEPIKIISLIARQFRIILQVKELSSKGYSQYQIASQLSIHPYAVKIADGQGKLYQERDLVDILNKLAELDYQIKSGQIEKVLGIEKFLFQVNI
ncbi:DNA polymerase III subunit delta [Chengkuizengella axinellae]|uniref:DNA polymerase III subunit delta n=1 Tax=Chengkuizengella axinellae TaxID=3064388 RepID=A0ABT9IUM1_9BACL|nr:DNA polymerase III subunit delta [Chengkuizengella sp. 2205SS18-9]MDP5273053.1 DNA polymerase III subunit delta [Chengkuizengella sp. 2205SS18-9]